MTTDTLPAWVLFLMSVGMVLLSAEIGFRVGRAIRGKTDDERESPALSISGVILGLLSFMLAFTFGIVSNRLDSKKALVRNEANVIRTTFHRADFLQEPDRGKSKSLLQEYVDQRITVGQSFDAQLAYSALGSALRMQQQLWDIAVANGRINMDSDVGALYVQSVNEMAELHAMRVAVELQARVPTAIWAVLVSLLVLGMIGVGYHTAIADSRRSRVAPILAVAFSLVIALIAALDDPGNSLIPVSQQPLIDVLSEMKASSP